MTPADNAGGKQDSTDVRKSGQKTGSGRPAKKSNQSSKKPHNSSRYAKRVDEVSAGGLVIDKSGSKGLLIGRLDPKDASHERL